MSKLTKHERDRIKWLRSQGMTVRGIADIFNVSIGAVNYWSNKTLRKKKLEYIKKIREEKRDWKHRKPQEAKAYAKKYYMNRFNTDPEFKRKHNERQNKWHKDQYKQGISWQQRNKERHKQLCKRWRERQKVKKE